MSPAPPAWPRPPAVRVGGRQTLRALADPAERAKIRAEVLDQKTEWENMGMLATPENILILGLEKPANKKYAGKRLADIAQAEGKHWLDAAMDLILSEHKSIGTVYFMMSEENVRLQLRQPWIKFGTDAEGIDPEHATSLAHPRAYGTFPRILGKYVRDEKVMPLEEAIRKMTSAVADRLSIRDRGLLREGFWADVVIFDPETIADRATYEKPHQLSVGIRDVFVNGTKVVRDGRHTGAKPGQIVRGPGYRACRPTLNSHLRSGSRGMLSTALRAKIAATTFSIASAIRIRKICCDALVAAMVSRSATVDCFAGDPDRLSTSVGYRLRHMIAIFRARLGHVLLELACRDARQVGVVLPVAQLDSGIAGLLGLAV